MMKLTAPHSGHFMTSNLNDEANDLDNEVEEVRIDEYENAHRAQKPGYNFDNAAKTPQLSYSFGAGDEQRPAKKSLYFDNTLAKLFACMSIAYSGKLTSPKFNAFKGLKINIKDKLRLNNIIWREWHLQYVKQHRPLVCSFTINMEELHSKPQSVVLEGKYWKRRLEMVCVEYKKWRVFYKKRIMPKWREGQKEISELLERVAEQNASTFIQTQNMQTHDTLQLMDEELKMDFSDTLFTSLAQQIGISQTGKDHYGYGNSDFMQPNLIGLQPSLDDFVNMDTMEPFQDLLYEAFGLSSTSGSCGSLYAGASNSLAASAGSSRSGSFVFGRSGTESPVPLLGVTSFFQPSAQVPGSSSVTTTSNSYSTPSAAAESPLYCANSLDSMAGYAVMLQPGNQSNSAAVSPSIWLTSQSTVSSISLPQSLNMVLPSQEFTKPQPSKNKPRSIAPRVTVPAVTMPLVTTEPQNSFLAQLLTTSYSVTKATDVARLITPKLSSSTSHKPSLSGQLVALSATDVKVTGLMVDPPTFTSSGTFVKEDCSKDGSPPPADEISSLLRFGDDQRAGHSSAEQKRRCYIKNGFDTLATLVPSLMNNPSAKVSKAAVLQKTADYTLKLKQERQHMQEEAELLHKEIDALNTSISQSQSQLPATGAPVTRQHSDQMKQMLDSYIRERVHQNYKFYIFSQLASPLFDSFNTMVSTANLDELYRTTQAWLDQHCALPALRPAILLSLRNLGVNTSILNDPSRFPEQAREAVSKSKPHSSGS